MEDHASGSRPDLVLEIHSAPDGEEAESSGEVVMVESKVGSGEGADQLERYAGHLDTMKGYRKTLVYITRNYDPRDAGQIETVASGVKFRQLRWHDLYRFLQTV